MTHPNGRTIFVTGATGHQGSAVARHLLRAGWQVRALTRDPTSGKARALSTLGAEVVQGDMGNPATLRPLVAGVYGVYSVQNPMISGMEAEIRQGKNVADVASEAGVHHLVYGSAGIGTPGTGIDSWESKLQIEAHMRSLDLPMTVLRPMALMELMTDRVYVPPVSTWHLMPKLMGADRSVGWVAADDIGGIAAAVFANPDRYIGQDLRLTSDIKTINQCRAIFKEVIGRSPRQFPMPVWMFERFVGPDLITMWRWLGTNHVDFDLESTRKIYPQVMSVDAWLRRQDNNR